MNLNKNTLPNYLMAFGLAALAAGPLPSAHAQGGSSGGGSGSKSDIRLISTGIDANASGRAKLKVRTAADGRFELRLGGLDLSAPYEIVVSGVRVGDVTTDTAGEARVRMRTNPRSSNDTLLGFDPRGSVLVVRDSAGQDILAGDLPAGGNASDDTKIVCCIPDDKGPECEDRTPDECVAQGGTVSTATTCMPNPCDTAVVPTEDKVVCCIPDDAGPECEDRTVEACSADGGIVVAADSCLDNPCAGVPAVDTLTRCCTGDDSGNECEVRLPSECLARGGVDIGAGVCSVDACSGVTVPTGLETIDASCEVRQARSKASVTGSGLANGDYTTHLVSGASEVTTIAKTTLLGEVQFEFDSEASAGTTGLLQNFLAGNPPTMTAQILDANGVVVLESTVTCKVK